MIFAAAGRGSGVPAELMGESKVARRIARPQNGDESSLAAIVLAGGEGRRMGGDKRGVVVAGRPMLVSAIDLAAGLTDEVIVSCRRTSLPDPGLLRSSRAQLVFDLRESGPLAGLEAGLAATNRDLVVVLPVDMPGMNRAVLEALVRAACERPDGDGATFVGQPGRGSLPAVLRRRVLATISEQLDRGILSIRELFDKLDLAILPASTAIELAGPEAFRNVNSPTDLERSDRKPPDHHYKEDPMDLEKSLDAVRALDNSSVKPVAPTEAEIEGLLDFTRAVAHAGERKDAPLAAYAMGIAMAGLAPDKRAEALSQAAAAVDRAAGNTGE